MRLINKTAGGVLLLSSMSLTVIAQQVPNGNFESPWEQKAPWTSSGNTKAETSGFDENFNEVHNPLMTPQGWTASNVIGVEGLGATPVASKCEGRNGGNGVFLVNTANPFMATQIVPAYLTLGTSWSTSFVNFTAEGIIPEKNDGGSFGGIKFTNRPDALQFYYKLTREKQDPEAETEDPTIKPKEKTTVVAYLWKGNWTQKDVPGDIVMATVKPEGPKKADMVNRDRNILGIDCLEGGEISQSEDAELIAVLNTNISYWSDVTNWTLFNKELEYSSDATPEMLNIIISAGDYFGGADAVGKNNSISIDDVKLIYYSRLKSLKVGETEITLADGVYDYYAGSYYPESADAITYELLGKDAQATLTMDVVAKTATIKVINVDADNDGEKEHTYTIHFASPVEANPYQPTNYTFEDINVNCVPWTSKGNTKVNGTQPIGWTLSHVIGINGTGKTETGSIVPGYESNRAVKIINRPNPFMATQIVPGYLTLGTTWSTSVLVSKKDGGTFGGVEFTNRPDGLEFMYTRARGAQDPTAEKEDETIKPEEKTTVVAYLWKGHWTQSAVPGEIVMFGTPKTIDMVDRDRCVLGMDMSKVLGGEVSKSDDAELIASLNIDITENTSEWTKFFAPLDYKSDATPAMANIIIGAGDYFGGADVVGKDNSMTVDNVRFVYFSRLKSLSVGDSPVTLKEGTFDYNIESEMPAAEAITYELLGQSAQAAVAIDKESNKATITVNNVDADMDGENTHVYTLTFKTPAEPKSYPGYLNINMAGTDIAKDEAATVVITPTSDNKCDFLLPNLTLPDLGNLGNIEVKDVKMTTTNGTTTYNGSVDGMKLMGGGITANVTIEGTSNEAGQVNMNIDVLWVEANLPIKVTFTSNPATTGINDIYVNDTDAPVEYFNLQGVRVDADNLVPGIYVRRQGSKTDKVIVK